MVYQDIVLYPVDVDVERNTLMYKISFVVLLQRRKDNIYKGKIYFPVFGVRKQIKHVCKSVPLGLHNTKITLI
jgi:hypothetical protein